MDTITKFEVWRKLGITKEDALAYADWLGGKTKIPVYREDWMPTPLPVVYFGKDRQFICLPFVDIEHKDLIIGVAVDNLCFDKNFLKASMDGGDVTSKGFIGVDCELKELSKSLYPNMIHAEIGSFTFISCHYGRLAKVPDLNEMQKAYMQKEAFNATIEIMRQAGVNSLKLWKDEHCYICRDLSDPKSFHQAVDFGSGKVVKYDACQEGRFFVRAVLPLIARDPEAPFDAKGNFDWKIYEEKLLPLLVAPPSKVKPRKINM